MLAALKHRHCSADMRRSQPEGGLAIPGRIGFPDDGENSFNGIPDTEII